MTYHKKTVISVSKRTDVPHWHSDWFMGRMREGYVEYKNPMGPQRVKLSLLPEDVQAFVFWTKNFSPMLKHMKEFMSFGIPFYTQFTLNDYPVEYEAKVPSLERRVETWHELVSLGAPVHWRYDPIILSNKTTAAFHLETFDKLCEMLKPTICHVSFLDLYNKTTRNMSHLPADLKYHLVDDDAMQRLSHELQLIAQRRGVALVSCCEPSLSLVGVPVGACVDGPTISDLSGLKTTRGCSQRKGCGCVAHRDLGEYDTCATGCSYCYAVSSKQAVVEFLRKKDEKSPSLRPLHLTTQKTVV